MTLRYLPLLQVQRDLYRLPRGMERFRAYLGTLRDADTGDLALPLVAMNPMGQDHVPALIDEYLAFDTDRLAAEGVAAISSTHAPASRDYQVSLVVSDDRKGGWTNRFASEFSHRFEPAAMLARGWIVGVAWTSEPADPIGAVTAVRIAIHRAAYLERHGPPDTLAAMLAQEGWAAAKAGATAPSLETDDLAYTSEVLAPLGRATDRATQMAALFGDGCATSFGYPPLGLSPWAGLALALDDAQAESA